MRKGTRAQRLSELERFLFDAVGFIQHCVENVESDKLIAQTLIHDIVGLAERKDCFSPRVTGYGKKMVMKEVEQ